jgi:prolyl 4-hydroxylase
VCNTCDIFTVEGRCKIDPDAIPIWKEGDLDAMFVKLTSEPYKSMYDVEILSIDPWVITMENVISDEEADRFIELGAIKGYKRSMNVGDRKADGSFAEVVSDHRTSHNAWCHKECQNDTTVIGVKDRLSEMTGVPANNAEFIQLLRYEEGQFYKVSWWFV